MSDETNDSGDRAGHLKGYRWPKGTSGNPGGRPRGASVTAHLRALLRQGHNGKAIAALVAERLLKEALSGKPAHIQMILERTEGRVGEGKEGGEGGEPRRILVLNVPGRENLPALPPGGGC